MTNSVLNWVWDHSRSRHGARLVLLALADQARDDGTAWPSVAALKRRTGLGDRAVQSAIIELAKLGELEVGYQQGPKGCNRYRVLMGKTPADIAGVQSLRGADSAPPQELRGSESPQVSPADPADIAPPADSAPPQIFPSDPANFADEPSVEPSPKSKSSSRRRDLNEGREDVQRLCEHLAKRIIGNGCRTPKIGKDWLDAARLMIDKDKLAESHLHAVIDWCQDSEFWKGNILSMPTLRDKYDQLRLQAEADRARKARAATNGHSTHSTPPAPRVPGRPEFMDRR